MTRKQPYVSFSLPESCMVTIVINANRDEGYSWRMANPKPFSSFQHPWMRAREAITARSTRCHCRQGFAHVRIVETV